MRNKKSARTQCLRGPKLCSVSVSPVASFTYVNTNSNESSESTESAATTISSVHDPDGDDSSDVEEVDRNLDEMCCWDDLPLRARSTCMLISIGAQFSAIDPDIYISDLHRIHKTLLARMPNLPALHSFIKFQFPHLHTGFHRKVPVEPTLTLPEAFWTTWPRTIPPLSNDVSELFASHGTREVFPFHAEPGIYMPLVTSSRVRTISSTSEKTRKMPTPNFLNPLFVLDRDKFGGDSKQCLGCYRQTYNFFRAIFNQIIKNADAIGVSNTEIHRAKKESDELKHVKAKLRKIWECLFAQTKPFPNNYPIAGPDHKHEVPRNGKSRALLAIKSTPTTMDSSPASSELPSQTLIAPPSVVPDSFDLPQPSIQVSSEMIWPTIVPGLDPTALSPDLIPVPSEAQAVRINGINQHLLRLHRRSHGTPPDGSYLDKALVLRGVICSVRSFLEFATNVIFSMSLNGRTEANAGDLQWPETQPPQLDPRDLRSKDQEDSIEAIGQQLLCLHERAHSTTATVTQGGWRSSVLDVMIQKIRSLLDEATRNMDSSPVPWQSTNIGHHEIDSLLQPLIPTPYSQETSQSSRQVSSSDPNALSRTMSTLVTSLDSDFQDVSGPPKS